MHRHDLDELTDTTQAESRTRREVPDPLLMKAAAVGRTEVLGAQGLLGLQRAAGNGAASAVLEEERSPVHDVVNSAGAPLDRGVRAEMESRMGHDFGDVRIHSGEAADASARSVSAHAYTVGSNIVFQRGTYDPGSHEGQKLLAHELTHVVQQRSGPVDGAASAGGISVSDPSDRFEREAAANAERVMSQPAAVQRCAEHSEPNAGDGGLAPVQRDVAEEDEEVAGLPDRPPDMERRPEEEEDELPV